MDIHGPGRDLRGNKQPQDPTMYCGICGSICLMQRKNKAKQKWAPEVCAAMPCKLQRDKYRETCRTVEEHKTKYVCIVEADESMRKRWEGSPHKNHEDHVAGKGMNSLSRHNLVHKCIPVLKQRKFQMQRQQWKQNGEHWKRFRRGT